VKKCAIILVLAIVAALAAFTAAAHADGVTVSKFPISFSLFDPCTNEIIDFSGTAMAAVDLTPDNHGLVGHSAEIHVTGVGETTGMRYIETFTNTVSIQGTEATSDNGSFVETTVTHSRDVAPGSGNDLIFAIVSHITINAVGEVVGFHNDVTIGVCT
jgi:hypothetical protein